jgi:hypothetical protein
MASTRSNWASSLAAGVLLSCSAISDSIVSRHRRCGFDLPHRFLLKNRSQEPGQRRLFYVFSSFGVGDFGQGLLAALEVKFHVVPDVMSTWVALLGRRG